jgi:hypothetical protein
MAATVRGTMETRTLKRNILRHPLDKPATQTQGLMVCGA